MLRLLLCLTALAQGAVLTHQLRFDRGQFQVSADRGYDVVLGAGMDVTDEPGAPQLPVQPVVIALPGQCRVTAVTFEADEWQELKSGGVPFPCQQQRVLVDTSSLDAFTVPNPDVYAGQYPVAPASWTGTSFRGESTLVQVLVYPLRHVAGRLEVCRAVRVRVEYEPEQDRQAPPTDAFEYVIVTGAGFDTVFQRLADWKTRKGVKAVVRDIGWVTATFPGRDDAEKLRNYVKTLPDSGVRYLLLGGDVDVVPFRKAFAMACEWGSMQREDSLPCDLYFADLQGDWDANGNGTFGETDDNVDLYADIAVGRAPVDQLSEAQTFVGKVLDYEHGVVRGYQNDALFFAEVLWQDPYTDQGVHKNRLDAASFGAGYEVTRLYQSLGNETREAVMAGMRAGQNFLNHDGHGWIDVMQCGGSANRLRTDDADTITNAAHGILYSIGCWTTAFDFTSIGEAFVTNPHGGTVATIGNSSYGWGSPGNPGFGYSDKFDNRFWQAVMNEGKRRVGDALDWAKAYYAPFSRDRNVYRWHQYCLNLMGDPELPVWTAIPRSIAVSAPAAIGSGPDYVQVSASDAGRPVRGALVCLTRTGEEYSRGRTDAAGTVWLSVGPHTAGDFTLTVTAHNYLPYESAIPSVGGAHVAYTGWALDDSLGNGDGVANPGEDLRFSTWIENTGDQPSGPLTLRLRTTDPRVTVLDSICWGIELAPGEVAIIVGAFRTLVDSGPYDGVVVRFLLDVTDAGGTRTFRPVLLIGEPKLALDRWWIPAAPLLPGETKGLKARLWNPGNGWGHAAWARLHSLDGLVTVASESIGYGEVQPLNYGVSADSFVVAVSGSCPGAYRAQMALEIRADGYARSDTFGLLIGSTGFYDDMESGESYWTHGGSGDMWHHTNYRAHSGGWSWYCGNEGTREYVSNMDASLTTVPLVVAEHCSLSYWRWFAVPNYGVDGIYTIVLHSGRADTLDFVGTGGALGGAALGIESNWAEERYDLSWLAPGETIQVQLAFKSDGDTVGEGFYIDDVRVVGGEAPSVGVAERPAPDAQCPTPGVTIVRGVLRIVDRRQKTGYRRELLDAAGRKVMELRPGANDVSGLAPGVYFVREVAGSSEQVVVKKVLIVR